MRLLALAWQPRATAAMRLILAVNSLRLTSGSHARVTAPPDPSGFAPTHDLAIGGALRKVALRWLPLKPAWTRSNTFSVQSSSSLDAAPARTASRRLLSPLGQRRGWFGCQPRDDFPCASQLETRSRGVTARQSLVSRGTPGSASTDSAASCSGVWRCPGRLDGPAGACEGGRRAIRGQSDEPSAGRARLGGRSRLLQSGRRYWTLPGSLAARSAPAHGFSADTSREGLRISVSPAPRGCRPCVK